MTKPINFTECKDRVELKQIVKGGIFAYEQLLEYCDAGAAYGTVSLMLAHPDKFATMQDMLLNFHSYIGALNTGLDYLERNGFIEEVNKIEQLNIRADKVYARLYRLYHDVLIAKQGDANVVLLMRK